ncbi:UNKNOWN [Stylonychia lemnae]|uniref:Conserved oligomeric Golgi complex subunit 4 n=1 Tax=Stylonychia lemnae TaxID=5949 RepID=A0A077ZQL4_STYLE|nr:UNKNOWN [Stylonychia lemnae]|eukprot:CDW72213.1 UNKNOWN [Stylonychia lemnae]
MDYDKNTNGQSSLNQESIQTINVSTMKVQLAQLKEKIGGTREFLESSNNLSQIINSGINSLETRKSRAKDTLNLFQDIIQLRGSYNQVYTAFDNNDLESAVYFMAKVISLMKSMEKDGAIKDEDRNLFDGLKKKLSGHLKDKMNAAISSKNEQEIEKIAQLFKSVEEQGEGMKYYSQYLMQNKVQCDIETIILDMFQKTIQNPTGQPISDYYGQVQRILIDCMENYSASIIQLFDFESLMEFVKNIDNLAKEKVINQVIQYLQGTQLIQHFINQSKLEKFIILSDNFLSEQGNSSFSSLSEDQEIQLDSICEEIIRFSQYYQTYCIYILQLIQKFTGGSSKHKSQSQNKATKAASNEKASSNNSSINNSLKLIQRQIQFPLIDELVNNYIVLEKFYLRNSLNKALDQDNQEYVKIISKVYNQNEKFDQIPDIIDFVDDYCYILDTCSKRAVQSFNIVNACAIINMINQILNDDIKQAFSNRVEIFLGKTSSKKFKPIHQVQNLSLVKDVVNLPLQVQLKMEFDQFIADLKVGQDDSDDSQVHQNFEILDHSKEKTKKLSTDLKSLGLNTDMFDHTLTQFRDTQKSFQEFQKSLIDEFFNIQANQDSLNDLFIQFSDVSFDINNQQFNDYEKQDVFIQEFFATSKNMLKQFKKQLNPIVFQLFIDNFTSQVVILFKREIQQQQFSLLGSLYLDKIIRKLKNFIQYLSDKPITSQHMNELMEIAQLLSCENIDELEILLNEKTELIVNKTIKVEEIKEIIIQRVDLDRNQIDALLKNYA